MPDRIEVRKAVLQDIPAIAALVNSYATMGVMLPRTEFELAESIRDFMVAAAGNRVVGCGALHIYTSQSAEIRSLAVDPNQKGRGVGRQIVETLELEAVQFGLFSLFAFTYVAEFFAKLGFAEVDRDELPLKAWKDCLKCPKFRACDEIPVLKRLKEFANTMPDTPIWGEAVSLSIDSTKVLKIL